MFIKVTTRLHIDYGVLDPNYIEVKTRQQAKEFFDRFYGIKTEATMGPVRGGKTDGCYNVTLRAAIDCSILDEMCRTHPKKAYEIGTIVKGDYFNKIFGHEIQCEEAMTWRYIQPSDIGDMPVFILKESNLD